MSRFDAAQLAERLEELAGARRGAAIDQAAVRLVDLKELLRLPVSPKSAKAGGAPTQAEFNALVEDVHAIHKALRAVSTALQGRRRQ